MFKRFEFNGSLQVDDFNTFNYVGSPSLKNKRRRSGLSNLFVSTIIHRKIKKVSNIDRKYILISIFFFLVTRNKLTVTDVEKQSKVFESKKKKKIVRQRGKKLIERKIIKSTKIRGTKEE